MSFNSEKVKFMKKKLTSENDIFHKFHRCGAGLTFSLLNGNKKLLAFSQPIFKKIFKKSAFEDAGEGGRGRCMIKSYKMANLQSRNFNLANIR